MSLLLPREANTHFVGGDIEKPLVVFTVGTLPNPKLHHLAASYPFTQQVDVLFPSFDRLEDALKTLKTCYVKTNARLSDMVCEVEDFARRPVEEKDVNKHPHKRTMTVLSTTPPAFDDDRWCIDECGVLTLSVCVETYRRLGLVGTKVQSASKKGLERRVIQTPLLERGQSVDTPERRKEALKAWDTRREGEDKLGPWQILYHGPSSDITNKLAAEKGHAVRTVECQIRHSSNVYVPTLVKFPPPPSPKAKHHDGSNSGIIRDEDAMDDWNDDISAILEWIGMASLGAQRLAANDRVDPYVAVYEPPTPSRVGEFTRLRWCGFLSPGFVQSIIDIALTTLSSTQATDDDSNSFVAIICQTAPSTPVPYNPASAYKTDAKSKIESEGRKSANVCKDHVGGGTLCVVLANKAASEAGNGGDGTWLKADNHLA